MSFGLLAPAGTPAAIVTRLHDETVKVLADGQLRKKLMEQGYDLLLTGTAADYAAQIKADIAKWCRLLGLRASLN